VLCALFFLFLLLRSLLAHRDVETGRHLDRLREHDGAVTSLKFHENNLVTGSWDKTGSVLLLLLLFPPPLLIQVLGLPVRLWSLREKKCVQVLGVPPSTKSDKYCSICYDPEKEVVYGGRCVALPTFASVCFALLPFPPFISWLTRKQGGQPNH